MRLRLRSLDNQMANRIYAIQARECEPWHSSRLMNRCKRKGERMPGVVLLCFDRLTCGSRDFRRSHDNGQKVTLFLLIDVFIIGVSFILAKLGVALEPKYLGETLIHLNCSSCSGERRTSMMWSKSCLLNLKPSTCLI